MAVSTCGKDELIVQGAELMARVTTVARTLCAELSALPLDVVAHRVHTAIHVATLGVAVGQCMSWLSDKRQDEMAGGILNLLRNMRVLGRGAASVQDPPAFPPQWEELRHQVEAYRQRVVDHVWGKAGVVPFRHARR